MSRIIVSLVLTAGIVAGAGCAAGHVDGPAGNGPRLVEFAGEVVYVPLEGGFHGIISRDGRKLNPLNLDEPLSREGISIQGVYRIRGDMLGIRQWGTTVELLRQRRIY